MKPSSNPWKLALLVAAGTVLQLAGAVGMVRTASPGRGSLLLVGTGALVWAAGLFRRTDPGSRLLLLLPFVFPAVGPALFCVGAGVWRVSRRHGDLIGQVEFAEYDSHLVLPGDHLEGRRLLERVRNLQPAGDILKGQDRSLKQSVMSILIQTPSDNVVHLLQGARNDPDDEIRMIASTLLTRLEKIYMEAILRAEKVADAQERHRQSAEAWLSYADSGIPAGTLRDRALREALAHVDGTLQSGAPPETALLSRLLMEAIRAKNHPLKESIQKELTLRGDHSSCLLGDLTERFENRDFAGFARLVEEHPDNRVSGWFQKLVAWEEGRKT
ncbi:MAG: hypothetical protein M1297_08265 [Nitrospirae bacterium]|jgi:hypothetical protein|nr:hypothetical protein [Nitrospirota bacterium]